MPVIFGISIRFWFSQTDFYHVLVDMNTALRRKKMHSLYITSFVRLRNEPEPDLHGNELRIDPVAGWVMDHHYELSDSGPIWTGEAGK